MIRAVELARECLGTPFAHQGRLPGVALDCAGVLVHVMQGLGLSYIDQRGYPRRPYRGLLDQALADQPHLIAIPKTDAAAGDVLLFRIKAAPQHIGICAGETVIHAYSATGRVVEQSFDPWRSSLSRVYRIIP